MFFDFILHLYCSRGQFSHRVRLTQADFEPFIRDSIFSGLRMGKLAQDEEYHTQIIPILPPGKITALEESSFQPESTREEILGFEIVIENHTNLFKKRYLIANFRYRALQKALTISPCRGSLSTCGLLEFAIEASPAQDDDTERQKKSTTNGSGVVIKGSNLPMMRFEKKPLSHVTTPDEKEEGVKFQGEFARVCDFPIYVRGSLLSRIRRISRANLDRETAGFLIGNVFQDEGTPEIYAVIDDQIEAKHTEANLVSVTINSRTWMAFWDDVKSRGVDLQLLGWWHSHPFRILCRVGIERAHGSSSASDGSGDLYHRDTCMIKMGAGEVDPKARWTDSNAFLSSSDMFIHNSFFSWPYQIALVVDPRKGPESDIRVWGWRDGMVTSRRAFVILEEVGT